MSNVPGCSYSQYIELARRERQLRFLAKAEELQEAAMRHVHMAQLGTIDSNRLLDQMAECLRGVRAIQR